MTSDIGAAVRHVGDRLGMPREAGRGTPLTPDGAARGVFRLDWPGAPGVVAKLYPDDAGRAAFAVQRTLAERAGPDDPHLAIPDALLYDARSRILVQRPATGDNLAALIANGDVRRLAPAGRAVARLHSLEPATSRETSLADHVAELMRPHPSALGEAVPALRARIEAVLTGVASTVGRTTPPRRALHRDLHPRQMIADGDRVWIVDWDLADAGDPALDVGNLTVWFDTHLPAAAAAACSDRFLEGYAEAAGDGAIRRSGPYRAFTYLRLACKRFRLGGDVRAEVEPMLACAEGALT